MSNKTDVIIVGGGVVGCSIFHELIKYTKYSVTLLEKDNIASKATGASGGGINIYSQYSSLNRMSAEGFNYYKNFKAHTGLECGFSQTGYLLFDDYEHDEFLLQEANSIIESEYRTICLNKSSPIDILNHFAITGDPQIFYQPSAGTIDTKLACYNWLKASRCKRSNVITEISVNSIISQNKHVKGVCTNHGELFADVVIIAAGMGSNLLLSSLGMKNMIDVKSFQYNVYKQIEKKLPTIIDLRKDIYIVPQSNCLIAGFLSQDKIINDNDTLIIDYDQSEKLTQSLSELLTNFNFNVNIETKIAVDAFTDNAKSLTGRDQNYTGLYYATGYSGLGIKTAPAVAAYIRKLL